MDIYGIANMSMSMTNSKLAQSVSIAMLDKTMDLAKDSMAQMIDVLDSSTAAAPPPSTHLLDVTV